MSNNSAVVGICIYDDITGNIFIPYFTKESRRKVYKRENIWVFSTLKASLNKHIYKIM